MKTGLRIVCLLLTLVVALAFVGCAKKPSGGGSASGGTSSGVGELETDLTPTVYLAGDSTVKTYEENQYIAGWGQYLEDFLDGITVANAAHGGRSSRSFINEGRLYDIDDPQFSYSFSHNGGKSIGAVIKEGDFLFIQFGHNDDDTKMASSYTTIYDRMSPLGTPDANGVYPVTAPAEKASTEHLPDEYLKYATEAEKTKALAEIAKYGSKYYSYDCGGTYKWYLKQYIDFAREKGAIPVLVTPVARVSFNADGTLRSGAGLHGKDFAYVKAVRQLAEEEDCLLIDLFEDTKTMLETATKDFANYLMAIVPNDLNNGPWPSGYDSAYGNAAVGFTKVEATHYNKYGAFLTAAKVAEHIIASGKAKEVHNGDEYFTFTSRVKTSPSEYIDPSNLMSKTKVAAVETLFTEVSPTNPNRSYPDPQAVVAKINEVCVGEVTAENYLSYKEKCDEALSAYNGLNVDDRAAVNNYALLLEYVAAVEAQVEAARPKPTEIAVFNVSGQAAKTITASESFEVDILYGEGSAESGATGEKMQFTVVGAEGKAVDIKSGSASFNYDGTQYSVSSLLSMGGSASFNASRYVEFTVTKACRVTVVAKSTGSDDRTLNLVVAGTTAPITAFAANASQSITSSDLDAGTYRLGSAGSGIYIISIIVEYYS